MQIAPLPADEELRLDVLRRYEILDSAPEEAFERITALTKRLFDVPVVLISLVDVDRQWFKSCIGLETRSTSRDVSFCAHAILADDVMVVPDARRDARFSDNPDVVGEPHIRFYAGAPLQTQHGVSLGTLCIIDHVPRAGLSPEETETLRDLARIAVDAMELRLVLRKAVEREQELRRAKAAAEESSAAKSLFLSRMSHEFRTPLNAILGFTQLLEGEDLTQEQKEDLAHIGRAGGQLLRLLTEALDLSRLEAGRVRLVIEDVALEPVLAAAARAAGADRTTVDVAGELRVLADPQRLEEVVTELARNALRHGSPETRVRMTARVSDDMVAVDVADDGPGLDESTLEAAFDPFERGSTGKPGLGLGLTLARRTMQAMGGSLSAESAPGRGTTMTLTLPPGGAGPRDRAAETSILYVDDNPSNLRLVEKILTRRPGMRLHLATTGAEGVAVARQELPDVVLLDLHLPDTTGGELLQTLRSDARTAHVPVVIVTGDDDPAVRDRLTELGAVAFLTKPLDAGQLVDTVISHLPAEAVGAGA